MVALGDYMTAIVNDLKANAPFLKDVATHGKVLGLTELQRDSLTAPACRIALIGALGGSVQSGYRSVRTDVMGRADTGQFRGPLQLIAFLIAEAGPNGEPARDQVIKLADTFMTFFEYRTFGLSVAGPAFITGFEILYAADIDALGVAIAAVKFEQEIFFGRDLNAEDPALLTGDEYSKYPSGQVFFPEHEWSDKGRIVPTVPPAVVKGEVSQVHVPASFPDDDLNDTTP
jgi:hypothetical protein